MEFEYVKGIKIIPYKMFLKNCGQVKLFECSDRIPSIVEADMDSHITLLTM